MEEHIGFNRRSTLDNDEANSTVEPPTTFFDIFAVSFLFFSLALCLCIIFLVLRQIYYSQGKTRFSFRECFSTVFNPFKPSVIDIKDKMGKQGRGNECKRLPSEEMPKCSECLPTIMKNLKINEEIREKIKKIYQRSNVPSTAHKSSQIKAHSTLPDDLEWHDPSVPKLPKKSFHGSDVMTSDAMLLKRILLKSYEKKGSRNCSYEGRKGSKQQSANTYGKNAKLAPDTRGPAHRESFDIPRVNNDHNSSPSNYFTSVVPNARIPWGSPYRAFYTLPKHLVILAPSMIPEAGLGLFAKKKFIKHTYLGQFEGEIIKDPNAFTEYSWCIYSESGKDREDFLHYIDASNVKTSNWLRWVNCSRHKSEENVGMKQVEGRILYFTTRDIPAGEELLLYYGDQFARQLHIDVNNYNTPLSQIT